jgi:hypothetical protein
VSTCRVSEILVAPLFGFVPVQGAVLEVCISEIDSDAKFCQTMTSFLESYLVYLEIVDSLTILTAMHAVQWHAAHNASCPLFRRHIYWTSRCEGGRCGPGQCARPLVCKGLQVQAAPRIRLPNNCLSWRRLGHGILLCGAIRNPVCGGL